MQFKTLHQGRVLSRAEATSLARQLSEICLDKERILDNSSSSVGFTFAGDAVAIHEMLDLLLQYMTGRTNSLESPPDVQLTQVRCGSMS